MKVTRNFALVVAISAVSLSAQHSTISQNSPKQVIDQFLKMVISGELQTSHGWKKADALFAHPRPMPDGKPVVVIGEDYSVRETRVAGNHAEVIVTYRELGEIDSSLHYSPPEASSRRLVAQYDLILTSKGTSVTAGTAEATGARQWRIENLQRVVWMGLAAAVRYVTEIRDKSTDPLIKRNASITLMELRKFQP